jgi:hypothetical protein
MKLLRLAWIFGLALTPVAQAADDWLDRLDEALTVSAFDGRVRARVSGLLNLEAYAFNQPAPGLIFSDDKSLFNARLQLNLDVQIGSHIYLFAQAALDRGFDPKDAGPVLRLDQFALRITPWDDGRFNVQLGKFGTVVGSWVARHDAWDNPFVTAPLPYENLTAIWGIAAPPTIGVFLGWQDSEKYLRQPIIWGPNYTTGAMVSGTIGHFDYAAEIKNASLASSPGQWDILNRGFSDPTFSARLGYRPNASWNLGFSVSDGAYLESQAKSSLPPGRSLGDYREIVLAQDISYAWHHLQLWAEVFETRFQVPRIGNANTLAYYLEAKYKLTPQFFAALRWNQQFFDTIPNGFGGRVPWGRDIRRLDAAIGYRFSAHTQLKLQYSIQHERTDVGANNHLFAAQFTARF